MDEAHPDARVAELARRQHGAVTIAQLGAAGLTRRAVAHRVGRGWLTPMHRGVYLVGPVEAPLSRHMGAVLAVGSGAVVSHASAAQVWGLPAGELDAVDVLVCRRAVRSRPGIRVHATKRLDAGERTVHHGIPVTTPARTLLDLAPVLDDDALARCVEHMELRRLATHSALAASVGRSAGRRGSARLGRLLEPRRQLTRSEAERRLLALVAAAALPTPAANTRVAGHEVDFLWPSHRLVVEVDGFAYHGSRAAFERDRRRDVDLQGLGYRVIRFTWRRLDREPHAVVAVIAAALAR